MAGKQITISATDGGAFGAWLAMPDEDAEPAPGIVMLHEIFGVTGWIRDTAEMFATHGYCVVAPDMFWRMQPGFEGDFRSDADTDRGRRYKAELDHDRAVSDIGAAIEYLKALPECNGRIGVTGFCTGGTMAYLAAARLPVDAAAPYYGTQIHEFLDEGLDITCPAIFHMGDKDDRVPDDLPETARETWRTNPNITVHTYDAGHAFAHTERPGYHVPDATRKAHERTFELFETLR